MEIILLEHIRMYKEVFENKYKNTLKDCDK